MKIPHEILNPKRRERAERLQSVPDYLGRSPGCRRQNLAQETMCAKSTFRVSARNDRGVGLQYRQNSGNRQHFDWIFHIADRKATQSGTRRSLGGGDDKTGENPAVKATENRRNRGREIPGKKKNRSPVASKHHSKRTSHPPRPIVAMRNRYCLTRK